MRFSVKSSHHPACLSLILQMSLILSLIGPNSTKSRTPTADLLRIQFIILVIMNDSFEFCFFVLNFTVKTQAENSLSTSAFSVSVATSSSLAYQQEYDFFGLSLLTYMLIELLLVILCIPCQAQFHLCLGFPHALPTHLNHIPVLFPCHLSLIH